MDHQQYRNADRSVEDAVCTVPEGLQDSSIEMTSPPRHKDTKAIHWKQQFFVT